MSRLSCYMLGCYLCTAVWTSFTLVVKGCRSDMNSVSRIKLDVVSDFPRNKFTECGQLSLLRGKINSPGLSFVAKTNNLNRCFIPSTENFFGGVRVPKVLCSSGSSSILLPLEEGQLDTIFSAFPEDKFIIATGISDGSPVITIEELSGGSFAVELCTNIILRNSSPSSSSSSDSDIRIKRLRFGLCSDDIEAILASPELSSRFISPMLDSLSKDLKSFPGRRPRRTHAILGQSVLRQVSSFRFSTVEFFVDSNVYGDIDWRSAHEDTVTLEQLIVPVLPEGFHTWRDDANLCHDEREDFDHDVDEDALPVDDETEGR